jgi:pseudouridine synthase
MTDPTKEVQNQNPNQNQKKKKKLESPELPEQDAGEALRLNVFLQRRGLASRRKADELILSGAVRVNRKVVTTLGVKVLPTDSVSVNGRVVRSEVPQATYLFNKPDLYLTTRKDSRSRNTIFDIQAISKLPGNVQPVGRLDFRSEGLLILTNDGDLAFALSHPKFHVEKTYAVLVSEQFTQTDLEKLRNGVDLPDGFAKPLSVKTGGSEKLGGSKGQWLKIVVTEGRNRLVRRMLAALGFKVVKLVRIGIGTIQLPESLQTGQIVVAPAHVLSQLELYKSRYISAETDGNTTILPPKKTDGRQGQNAHRNKPPARKPAETRARSVSSKEGQGQGQTRKNQGQSRGNFNPTYAGKKQAESMELAKQRRKRKQRNEGNDSL